MENTLGVDAEKRIGISSTVQFPIGLQDEK